jgi:superfamily II DNA or RNA helicase
VAASAATGDAVEQASQAAAATAIAHGVAQLTAVPALSDVVPVPAAGQPQFADAPFQLRPYQLEAIREIIKGWKEGNSAQLVMLPTGGGKTVLFAGE